MLTVAGSELHTLTRRESPAHASPSQRMRMHDPRRCALQRSSACAPCLTRTTPATSLALYSLPVNST